MNISFAMQILFFLIVLGGVIAYLGNYIGKLIGKRRLSLFNLRPKYTATLIAIISGGVIAFCTIVVILIISQDARQTFLGLEGLKKEIAIKSVELEQIKRKLIVNMELQQLLGKQLAVASAEITELQTTKEKLVQEIKSAREGQVIFRVGEGLSVSLIQAGPESDKLEAGLKQILQNADDYIHTYGLPKDKKLVTIPTEDFNQTLFLLLEENKIYVAKLVVTRNVVWGEDIPVRFELSENKLIYRLAEEIANIDIPAGPTAAEMEGEITGLLKLVHQKAREAGVIPDVNGSLGSLPYSQIYDLAKKIKAGNKKVNLKVLANRNIYSIGPLDIKFRLTYK